MSAIVAMILQLSAWNPTYETEQAYGARVESIAVGVSDAAKGDVGMESLLLSIAFHESGYDYRVHSGDCPKNGCDGGRSATLWQIMWGSWLPRSRWVTYIGVEKAPTGRAAAYAASVLRKGLNYCKSVRGAISLYATGRTCHWDGKGEHGIEARMKTYRRVLTYLTAAGRNQKPQE